MTRRVPDEARTMPTLRCGFCRAKIGMAVWAKLGQRCGNIRSHEKACEHKTPEERAYFLARGCFPRPPRA